jgi:GTPase involved in cell partitioning and DNA repair
MVPYDDYVQLAVADIPGIIKDAHKNKVWKISFLMLFWIF